MKSIRVHALEGSMVSTWKGIEKLYCVHKKEKEDVQIYVLPPTRDPDLSFYKLLDAAENKDDRIWNMLEQKKTAWLELASSSLNSDASGDVSEYISQSFDSIKDILKAVYDVLKTPHIIINEERETVFGDKKPSHVYAKSFEFNGKNKAVQSIVVAIEDDNVSISTHQREINNLINKIKMPDQVIYLSPEIGQVIERMTKTSVTVNPTRENKTVPPTKNIALSGKKSSLPSDYNKQIWNDYISAVRVYLPKEKLNDRKAVLEASKNALAIQADVTGAIGIINNEFSKRGVKSSATLVKAIKETAYPELKKKKSKDDDFGHGR